MMASFRKSIYFFSLLVGVLITGCVSAPRVIPISYAPGIQRPSADRIADYQDAIAAILSVMVEELKFPRIEATLILYPNIYEFESGLVTELRVEPILAAQTAKIAWAVASHKKVLASEWGLSRQAWHERIRVLAHEFTHTMEYALANGPGVTSDQWLLEGFADWVSYKVLEALGLDTFAKIRESQLDGVRRVRHYQTLPSLTQMVTGREFVTWTNALGREATFAQAFLAVDFLIERKGLPAVTEYFRLYGRSNNRLINFVTAFGEQVSAFEIEFSGHFQGLLK